MVGVAVHQSSLADERIDDDLSRHRGLNGQGAKVLRGLFRNSLDRELQHQGVQLLIARDIGQVRDVLRHVIDDPTLEQFYPTVQAAVDATDQTKRPSRRRKRAPSREPPHDPG